MGASNRGLLTQIVLPAAFPQINWPAGGAAALPYRGRRAWMLMGGYCLGAAMMTASRFAKSPGVFAGIVEIALVG